MADMSVEDSTIVRPIGSTLPLLHYSQDNFAEPTSERDIARFWIAMQHSGKTVLNYTFGYTTTLDRTERLVLAAAARAIPTGRPEDVFVSQSYCTWSASGYVPYGLPAGAIGFDASYMGAVDASDVVETAPFAPNLPFPRWCILDVRMHDSTRIIPATLLSPYLSQPGRCQTELARTDMLPLWFWRTDGSLGIPITASNFDSLPEKSTRIRATSLKVGFWWRNYYPLEKQIQLRTGSRTMPSPDHVSHRRLASTICGAVRNAMAEYENSDIASRRAQWEDLRWRVGSDPGCISVRDVVLLGLVYVSPGRVMPLLRI